jgi:hypothetical protein
MNVLERARLLLETRMYVHMYDWLNLKIEIEVEKQETR